MDSWRRQKGYNYSHEVTRERSHNKKPPLGSWQPTVPSWEKKFCASVGSVPWHQILETKRIMHFYESVVNWNDSAGEEAFHNAKNRFYAKMHGLPCDISLPDPDIYIDEIDWDSKIDTELLLDLECDESVVPDTDNKDECVVIFGNSLLSNQGFSSTGWGDSEEDFKRATNSSSENNGNSRDCNYGQNNGAVEGNGWGNIGNQVNGAFGNSGWGDRWNHSWGWNQYGNSNYGFEDVQHRSSNGDWETWDGRNGKREGTGRETSRYKTTRFRGEDLHRNHSWRNGNGRKRLNFVSEQPTTHRRPPSRQWNVMNSCAPISHHASGNPQGWSWEKPVS